MKLCDFEVGLDRPLFLIAGPCAAESLELCVEMAGRMKEVSARLGMPYIFKASYDKANRSSGRSARGPGLDEGLKLLAEVRRQTGVPVLTSAGGVGADRFGGFYDNTDIFSRMAEIMGLKKAAAVTSPVVTPVVAPAKEAGVMAQAAN